MPGAQEHMLVVMISMIPKLLRHKAWRQVKAEQGRGMGVLLVPGFGCGDRTLTLTARWLRARGSD